VAKKSDNYPLVFIGGGLALTFAFHTIWKILFEDWVKHQLERIVGQTMAEMIERFGATGFPALAAVAIIWFLVAYKKSAAEQPASKFFTPATIYCETKSIKWEDGDDDSGFHENIFYLVVGNAIETGQTLRRTQARIFHMGEPIISRVKETGGSEIDIRHGELALFEIGKIVSPKMFGMFHGWVVYDPKAKQMYGHNIPLGHLSFEVSSLGKRSYAIGHSPGSPPTIWSIWMVTSADEAQSTQARINIDLSKDKRPVTCEIVK
jgi:hypothetical protein